MTLFVSGSVQTTPYLSFSCKFHISAMRPIFPENIPSTISKQPKSCSMNYKSPMT
jgi:hypothetical protein